MTASFHPSNTKNRSYLCQISSSLSVKMSKFQFPARQARSFPAPSIKTHPTSTAFVIAVPMAARLKAGGMSRRWNPPELKIPREREAMRSAGTEAHWPAERASLVGLPLDGAAAATSESDGRDFAGWRATRQPVSF